MGGIGSIRVYTFLVYGKTSSTANNRVLRHQNEIVLPLRSEAKNSQAKISKTVATKTENL